MIGIARFKTPLDSGVSGGQMVVERYTDKGGKRTLIQETSATDGWDAGIKEGDVVEVCVRKAFATSTFLPNVFANEQEEIRAKFIKEQSEKQQGDELSKPDA
jgi:hypothetical protein